MEGLHGHVIASYDQVWGLVKLWGGRGTVRAMFGDRLMTIALTKFEKGASYQGSYARDLAALEERLQRIQSAYIIQGKSAVIAFEGWDASGKGGAIQRLTASWDPRYYEVWPTAAPSKVELAHHFLWRFKTRLPGGGEINVFDRAWYGRVLVERVEGYCSKDDWQRAYDQINTFEAKLVASGVPVLKFFLHITQKEQDKRFKKRLIDPWKRWKTGLDDYRNRARRADYLDAYHDMFERTNTDAAPWLVIDGNDKKAGRIAVLRSVADRLEAAVDMVPPPLDPELEKVARAALGKALA
jgi:AMP-polyphosphate phosphotransferase